MTNGPIEPDAEKRIVAMWSRQMFLALTQEGFTEQQALVIIGQILATGSAS